LLYRKLNHDTEEQEDFKFFDGHDIHEAFREISIANIKIACQTCVSVPGACTRSEMYRRIAQASIPIQRHIREKIVELMRKGGRMYNRRTTETDQSEILNSNSQHPPDIEDTVVNHSFMKAPSKQVIDNAIVEFIERTGNNAMAVGVCAVCARERNRSELTPYRIDLIPNPQRLQPEVPHPAHDIFNGMLLHPGGMTNDEIANVCMDCVRALNSDKTPIFALANGMWVGAIPHELAYLTLPERLLIAKYFPAAYIIKLYPKKKGARCWDKRQMYSGLKGNVSTYQLDQGQIASMIDGMIMPQPARLLAATIGITFVGPRNLPDKCFPDIFKVRRTRVQRALEWLKDNNPLFANITISASRLSELPEDDVPFELRATTKLSTDVSRLNAEHDGYVPVQETSEDESDKGKIPPLVKVL
jgi:hypothetical protein